ncbi:hypothetical protein RB623_26765 [Mesorhizobium sp. LHD-90]|uniref:hypothetical protein n=1 Tax=Mesorhizobium sp. LHD-90 TaxID=3071414 RepID=UPI0027E17BBF|nr:hypothetical protein [Mesorhizobium sp. LHD-90]MDQ6437669.1 hypothetical protein [Mesorhizobium sp. LHD-90]
MEVRTGGASVMRKTVLAGIFALSASASFAQTNSPQQPAAPESPTAPAIQTDASQPGGPANLCQELLAFMKAPPPEPATPATAAKPAPAQQGTTAASNPAKAEAGTGSAQKITGQDGVATDAPKPAKDNAASGSATNAPQKESRAAPLPPADVTSTPKETVLDMTRAEELATANDIAQCQKVAREMRVAGVAMPPPLIALAALDLQYQQ